MESIISLHQNAPAGSDQINPLPSIGIVIINWRRPELTLKCLASIDQSKYSDLTTIIVDNHSGDGSIEKIHSIYPGAVILEAEDNRGYTGANNLGIERLMQEHVEYFLLLNDDIILDKSAIKLLAMAARDHPRAGFLGPMIFSQENPEVILSSGGQLSSAADSSHRGMGEVNVGQYDHIDEMDFLSGSALMIKREVIEKIGRFDDRYFLYFEEVDWCLRGRKAGYQCLLVPQAHVYHPDTRFRDENSAVLTYYSCRNRLLLAKKHYGWEILISILSGYLRQVLSWTFRPKWRGKSIQRKALAAGLIDFIRNKYGKWEAVREA